MKQSLSISGLITVISLFFGVIWLGPAFAAGVPTFASLGQIKAAGLRVPGAMDLDAAGNLYVADARGGKVHKFSPYGGLLQSFDLQASGSGLAVTPDGARLYVSRKQSVVIVDAAGEVLGTLAGAEANGPEFGVAGEIDLDASGNIFVADAGSMQVKGYNASGGYVTRFGGTGTANGQFLQIGGMAVNPFGQVVVADSSAMNGKIQVFTLDASLAVTGVVAYLKQTAANFGAPVMHAPRGLAFDAQGRGYFLDFMTSQIRVTSANYGYLGAYAKAGQEAGMLNNVIDVIFDATNSRLFVGCDSGRIEVLGVDGGQSPIQINHAPGTPVQQSPIASSEVDTLVPTLVFANAADQDDDLLTYQVAVKQGDAVVYQATVAADAGETTSVTVSGVKLDENAAYSWTVQAFDATLSSAVSTAAFVVNSQEEAPGTPALLTPADNATVAGAALLSWTETVDPDPNDLVTGYQLEIASDAAFTDSFATQVVASNALSLGDFQDYELLEDGAVYFWRISAHDSGLLASAPSLAGQFVYDTTALTITANMPDAMVSFSGNHAYAGKAIGAAPIELRDFAPGTLSVVVERAGFETFVAQVTVTEGDNVALYAELVPAKVVGNLSANKKSINGRSDLSVNGAAAPFLVDFDNDGDLDLLVGDGSGQLTLFANLQSDGPDRFTIDKGVSLGLPVLPGAVPFVADWNNDGRKDLLVGQADGSVKLFLNSGLEEAPAFAGGVDLEVDGSTLSVGGSAAPVVIDFNGDGAKDLLVGNASGELLLFLNQGDDAAPALAAATIKLQVGGAVVPAIVDWDADGQKELLLTTNGVVLVYSQIDGVYQLVQEFKKNKVKYSGAFPININGKGKQLLVGQSDGTLDYLANTDSVFTSVASFPLALQAKVDELAGFVADANPTLLDDVATLGVSLNAGDLAAVKSASERLAASLGAGAARTSALQLAGLCGE